jgi:hypothetical protein
MVTAASKVRGADLDTAAPGRRSAVVRGTDSVHDPAGRVLDFLDHPDRRIFNGIVLAGCVHREDHHDAAWVTPCGDVVPRERRVGVPVDQER